MASVDLTDFTEEEKRVVISEAFSKEMDLYQFSEITGIPTIDIMKVYEELKNEGRNILLTKKNSRTFITDFGHQTLEHNRYEFPIDSNVIRIGAVSDTLQGSIYEQLTILNHMYTKFMGYGAQAVFHLGDLTAGVYKGKKSSIYDTSLHAHDFKEQKEYSVRNYPYVEGMPTLFLTGERDLTHMNSKERIDIGREIAQEREDMIYLGPNQCEVAINGIKLLAQHNITKPASQPKTLSCRPQEAVRVMGDPTKINFLLQGHNYQMQSFTMQGVDITTVPSAVARTSEMKDKGKSNVVGAYFIEFGIDKKGNVHSIKKISWPYRDFIENDYLTAKPLKVKGGVK